MPAPDTTSIAPLRILVVAPNASARWGGEAVLPLHVFRGLRAAGQDAWLCVGRETQAEIEELLGPDRDRVVYIEDSRKHALFRWLDAHSPRWMAPRYTYYYLSVLSTLLAQRQTVKRLIAARDIQIVHQVTPVSPKAPSMLFGLQVPLVIGPMNGGMEYPAGFRFMEARSVRAARWLGRAASSVVNRLSPGKREADVLLVANDRTARALPAGTRGKIVHVVENGVDIALWARPAPRLPAQAGSTFRLIFIGRLEGWKGAHWLLDAFARASRRADLHLCIVGDFKDERAKLTAEARRLGVDSRVEFPGWLPQAECAGLLAAADVLVLPSVFECGGAVVLEAMAAAKPVIAVDWGGPSDYLAPSCGVLLPASDPATVVEDMERAILRLAADRELCRRMGEVGHAKVEADYAWPVKIARLLALYRGMIDRDGRDTRAK